MENYKYIKNISEEESTILLYGEIGKDINGSSFASEVQYLQTVCSRINVRINSIGGSVLDGYSIVSAILNSTVPVDTYVDGLAASIAGVIAISGKKCYMMDYGMLMLHNPSGGTDQGVLDLVKNTIVTLFSNRTSKTSEEISAMMDVETWLDASQAINMGLVDQIITSKKKIRTPKVDSLYNMALTYNKLINNEMAETNQELETLKNELAQQKESNAKLQEKLDAAEARELAAQNKAKEEAKTRAEALVNKAVSDGKLKETEKADYITAAISNYAVIENSISKISVVKESTKVFDITKVSNRKGGTEDRSDWTIRDWEKKDEKGLAEIKNSTPELYTEMFNAHYKKSK